jgi:hypothetical protein
MIKYKYVPFSFGKKTYGNGSSVKLAKWDDCIY